MLRVGSLIISLGHALRIAGEWLELVGETVQDYPGNPELTAFPTLVLLFLTYRFPRFGLACFGCYVLFSGRATRTFTRRTNFSNYTFEVRHDLRLEH